MGTPGARLRKAEDEWTRPGEMPHCLRRRTVRGRRGRARSWDPRRHRATGRAPRPTAGRGATRTSPHRSRGGLGALRQRAGNRRRAVHRGRSDRGGLQRGAKADLRRGVWGRDARERDREQVRKATMRWGSTSSTTARHRNGPLPTRGVERNQRPHRGARRDHGEGGCPRRTVPARCSNRGHRSERTAPRGMRPRGSIPRVMRSRGPTYTRSSPRERTRRRCPRGSRIRRPGRSSGALLHNP
jgi:hypothetical protein